MSFALSFYGLGGAVRSPDMLPLLIGPPGQGAGDIPGGIDNLPLLNGSNTWSGPNVFSGTISPNRILIGTGAVGGLDLLSPSSNVTGYLALLSNAGVRFGYIGFMATDSSGASINYINENSGGHNFTGPILYAADNTYAGWSASQRPTVLYAVSGAINTSDEREKEWRSAATDKELDAAWECYNELGFYQWVDGNRFHYGLRAQRVWAIFAKHGLVDPIVNGKPGNAPFAFLCYDVWDEQYQTVFENEQPSGVVGDTGNQILQKTRKQVTTPAGDRFGFRPDQLDRLMMAALKRETERQSNRIAALEVALSRDVYPR